MQPRTSSALIWGQAQAVADDYYAGILYYEGAAETLESLGLDYYDIEGLIGTSPNREEES